MNTFQRTLNPYLECLYAWGNNNIYALNKNAKKANFALPKRLELQIAIETISCTDSQVFILAKNGIVYKYTSEWTKRVEGLDSIVKLSNGHNHFLALDSGGRVYAWGNGKYGNLGNQSLQYTETPQLIDFHERIIDVYCGKFTSFFITEDGELYGCGSNRYGELNIKLLKNYYVPTKIELGSLSIRQIAAGDQHTLYLTSSGDIYASGSGKNGRLGTKNAIDYNNKIQRVDTKQKFKYVAASNYSAAVSDKGDLYVWGSSNFGSYKQPNLFLKNKKIGKLAISKDNGYALTENQQIYVWGSNESGQLGLGDSQERTKPTQIQLLSNNCIDIFAGYGYAFCITSNNQKGTKKQVKGNVHDKCKKDLSGVEPRTARSKSKDRRRIKVKQVEDLDIEQTYRRDQRQEQNKSKLAARYLDSEKQKLQILMSHRQNNSDYLQQKILNLKEQKIELIRIINQKQDLLNDIKQKVKVLEQMITNKFRSESSMHEEFYSDFEEKEKHFIRQIEGLNYKLSCQQHELKQLKVKNEHNVKRNQSLQESLKGYEKAKVQVEELKSKLTIVQDKGIDTNRQKSLQITRLNAELEKRLAMEKDKNIELETNYQKIYYLQSAFSTQKIEQIRYNAQIERLEKENRYLREQLTNSETLKKKQSRLEKQEVKELQDKIQEQQDKLQQFESIVKKITLQNKKQVAQFYTQENSIKEEHKSVVKKFEIEKNKLLAELNQTKNTADMEKSALEKQLKHLNQLYNKRQEEEKKEVDDFKDQILALHRKQTKMIIEKSQLEQKLLNAEKMYKMQKQNNENGHTSLNEKLQHSIRMYEERYQRKEQQLKHTNERYQEEINKLSERMAHGKSEERNYINQIEQYKEQAKSLSQRCRIMERQMKNSVEKYQQQINRLSEQRQRTEQYIKSAEQRHTKELSRLTFANHKSEEDKTIMNQNYARQLQLIKKEYNFAIEQRDDRLNQFTKENKSLENQNQQYRVQTSQLLAQKARTQQFIKLQEDTHREQIQQLSQRLSHNQRHYMQATSKITEQLSLVRKQYDGVKEDLERRLSEALKENNQTSESNRVLSEENRKLAEINNILIFENHNKNKHCAESDKKIESLHQIVDKSKSIEEQLKQTSSKLSQQYERGASIKQEILILQKQINDLTARNSKQIELERQQKQKALSQKTAQIQVLTKQTAQLKSLLQSRENDYKTELQSKVRDYKNQIHEYNMEIIELKQQNKVFSNRLKNKEDQIEELNRIVFRSPHLKQSNIIQRVQNSQNNNVFKDISLTSRNRRNTSREKLEETLTRIQENKRKINRSANKVITMLDESR